MINNHLLPILVSSCLGLLAVIGLFVTSARIIFVTLVGISMFCLGFQGFFVIGGEHFWSELLMDFSMLLVLPLVILAKWHPGLSGKALIICALLCGVGAYSAKGSANDTTMFILATALPISISGALLLRGMKEVQRRAGLPKRV